MDKSWAHQYTSSPNSVSIQWVDKLYYGEKMDCGLQTEPSPSKVQQREWKLLQVEIKWTQAIYGLFFCKQYRVSRDFVKQTKKQR